MATYNITAGQLKAGGILNSFEMPAVGSFSNLYSTEFDGVDDYIDLGASSTVADSSQFSFSFWIKGGTAPSGGQTYLFSADYYNLHTFWNVKDDDIIWRNINNSIKTLSVGVLDNSWHHILIVFNPTGADQTIRCFTDGANEVNVSTDHRYKQSSSTYTGALRYIGNRGGGSYTGFSGNIDEVAIWDDDQSANVSAIYNSGQVHNLNDLSSPPINWYRFEEGSGTTATDSGTGGNNGTLTNGVTYSTDVPT